MTSPQGEYPTRHNFRVWWIPQIPGRSFIVETPTLQEAYRLADVLAQYDLFQYDERIKPDYANAGGVQQWDADAGEWEDLDENDFQAHAQVNWEPRPDGALAAERR